MWFCKSKPVTEETGKSRKELEAELVACKKIVDDINDSLAKCTTMIDFDEMRVFSIERLVSENRPATIIGYYMNEPFIGEGGGVVLNKDVVHEWTIYCDNNGHEQLVKNYLDWKAKK